MFENYYCESHHTHNIIHEDRCRLGMATACDIRVLVPVTHWKTNVASLSAIHDIKIALTKACFLDDAIKAQASEHPGWEAWSLAYNSLFDIKT